jgi:hypothetical protein
MISKLQLSDARYFYDSVFEVCIYYRHRKTAYSKIIRLTNEHEQLTDHLISSFMNKDNVVSTRKFITKVQSQIQKNIYSDSTFHSNCNHYVLIISRPFICFERN